MHSLPLRPPTCCCLGRAANCCRKLRGAAPGSSSSAAAALAPVRPLEGTPFSAPPLPPTAPSSTATLPARAWQRRGVHCMFNEVSDHLQNLGITYDVQPISCNLDVYIYK